MLKFIALAAIAIAPFLLNVGAANAQGKAGLRGDSVRCPLNTCGKTGKERAKNVKNCSAANCPKNGPK